MNDKMMKPEEIVAPSPKKSDIKKPSRRKMIVTVVAAVLCVLLALAVWVCVMNTQDTDYIPVRVEGPAGYECTLSVDGVEVEGKVATLRNMDEIVVKLTAADIEDFRYFDWDGDGKNEVNELFLGLPDGVQLTREFSAELTVKVK